MNKRFGIPDHYLVGLLLVLAVSAVYLRVLGNGFTNYDDDKYVLDNVTIHSGPTAKNIAWAFTTFEQSNWHPLTWISHMLDCRLYGPDPSGHHFTNLALHVGSTLLLFLALMRMTGSAWKSGFVAALFGLHPLHVESAAWVAERKDVLSAFFWMLTMWAYVRYSERPGTGRYALVIAFFALGLMSKPMLVTLPLVLLLLDYWPLGRFHVGAKHLQAGLSREGTSSANALPLLIEKIPIFAMTLASCIVTYYAQHSEGAIRTLEQFPVGVRIANALVAYVVYIRKMVWPSDLAAMYPHPGDGLPMWSAAVSVLLLAGLSYLAVRAARSRPYVGVGWLWYVGTLVPVIGLVQVGDQAMADRYTYIPLIGLFIMLAWSVPELVSAYPTGPTSPTCPTRPILPFAAFFALVALSTLTYIQIGYWKNSETLFTHTLAHTRNNEVAHNNYGIALTVAGRVPEAVRHFRRAMQIAPQYGDAHGNLGNIYDAMGRYDDAIREYREVLRLNPGDPRAYYNLGNVLAKKGKAVEAMRQYNKSLEKATVNPGAHINRGKMLAAEGKLDEALEEYRAAIKADPRIAEAHYNLGLAYKRLNRLDDAMKEYREAIRLEPKWPAPHNNLANVLLLKQDYDAAIKEYKEAIRLNPAHAEAHNNMAAAHMYKGDYAAAWKEIKLCRKYGFEPPPALIQQLSQKMPEPR